MLLLVDYNMDADRYSLEVPKPAAHGREGVHLTDDEWSDYQRAVAEFDGWQTLIEKRRKEVIPADDQCVAADLASETLYWEMQARERADNERLQAAKDADRQRARRESAILDQLYRNPGPSSSQ